MLFNMLTGMNSEVTGTEWLKLYKIKMYEVDWKFHTYKITRRKREDDIRNFIYFW